MVESTRRPSLRRRRSMKVKHTPEDFQVEELTTVRPADQGRYTLYSLSKRGIGTLEAVEAICRRWNLSSRQGSYGGVKGPGPGAVQDLPNPHGAQRPPPH